MVWRLKHMVWRLKHMVCFAKHMENTPFTQGLDRLRHKDQHSGEPPNYVISSGDTTIKLYYGSDTPYSTCFSVFGPSPP